MPRPNTTKTIAFSTFKHPRPAPSPPSQSQFSTSKFAKSEGSLLRSHGLSLDNGGGFTYDGDAVFRPRKQASASGSGADSEWGEYIGLQRGRLRSWVRSWARKKWVTLQENFLCASQSKGDTEYTDTLRFDQVGNLYAVESRRFCCAICTTSDTWYLIFNDGTTFQAWMAEIHRRCPFLNISGPSDIKHLLHVKYDSDAGQIQGLPIPWIQQIGLLADSNTTYREPQAEPDIEEVLTPMTEPLHSPVPSSSSHSASSLSSPSQRHQQRRRQQQRRRREEQLVSCSMPTPTSPMVAARASHQRDTSHVRSNISTFSPSPSDPRLHSESEFGLSPGLIRTQQHTHTHQRQHKPDIPSSSHQILNLKASTSTFMHYDTGCTQPRNGQSQQSQSPVYCENLKARDLTGSVQTVHLLPIAQTDYYDTWKGTWKGQFGTRQVSIHVFRFANASDSDNHASSPTGHHPQLKNRKLIQKFSSIILHELKGLHQFRHPNVVRIRGYTTDLFLTGVGGVPAYVSTWITGPNNIMEYLNDTTPVVNAKQRLKWLAEAASGLAYIHAFPYQTLHGSLRGSQIQLQIDSKTEPVAVITGFGFNPLLADEDAKWALPNTKPSPRWAAPEVIFGGRKEMTDMADVFAFGRCVVEVLTSQQPYPHVDSDENVQSLIITSASRSRDSESVYYPKPKLKFNDIYQQQRHPGAPAPAPAPALASGPSAYQTQSPHDQETIRTIQNLWPLLKRCWMISPASRPSMESVRNGLLGLVNGDGALGEM